MRITFFTQRIRLLSYSKVLLPFFSAYCVICMFCSKDALQLNLPSRTSLADILTLQFNTYSYVFLFLLPVFIIFQSKFLRTDKFSEFILARYKSRGKYLIATELDAFKFCFIYRCVEIVTASIIFSFSCLMNSVPMLPIWSISAGIQRRTCISVDSGIEALLICILVQVLLLLLYFFLSQIIIGSTLVSDNETLTISITLCLDFLFLVLIKINFWFDAIPYIRSLLPHSNIFLEYIFNRNSKNYVMSHIVCSISYWCATIAIAIFIIAYLLKYKNFMYQAENTEQDLGR